MIFHWGAGLGQRIKNDKVETRTNRPLESKKNIHITKKAIIPQKAIKRQTLEDAGIYIYIYIHTYII